MDKKEAFLLLVLDELDEVFGRTFLQKLIFLIEKQGKSHLGFEFIKYLYGPFSKDLNETVNKMVEVRLIEEEIKPMKSRDNDCFVYKLTKKGKDESKRLLFSSSETTKKTQIRKYCKRFKHFSPTDILKYVYQEYPKWAVNNIAEIDLEDK